MAYNVHLHERICGKVGMNTWVMIMIMSICIKSDKTRKMMDTLVSDSKSIFRDNYLMSVF